MRARLHPPALALYESLSTGRFDAAAWLREWYGDPRALSYVDSRAAADDLSVVLAMEVRRGAAYESALRLYRALSRRSAAVPQTTVETKWKRPPPLETPAALEGWLEQRFGKLKALDGARRRHVRSALDMLEAFGLVAKAASIHAALLKCALDVPPARARSGLVPA